MIKIKETILSNSREDHKRLYDKIKELDFGMYKVIVYDQMPEKSLKQLRYFFGVVCKVLSGHTGFTKEEIYAYLIDRFNKKEVTDPITGKVKAVGIGVSALTLNEMREFIETVSHWAHRELGCEIPSPDDVTAQELYEES